MTRYLWVVLQNIIHGKNAIFDKVTLLYYQVKKVDPAEQVRYF